MSLKNDETRCPGGDCPSRFECRRYTERRTGGERAVWAALYVRREAGASACDQFLPVVPVSTFKGGEE